MPLTLRTQSLPMEWCLDAIATPQKYLRPREQVFTMGGRRMTRSKLGLALVKRYHIDTRRLTDCSVCHR